jgi:hypothetical protein
MQSIQVIVASCKHLENALVISESSPTLQEAAEHLQLVLWVHGRRLRAAEWCLMRRLHNLSNPVYLRLMGIINATGVYKRCI